MIRTKGDLKEFLKIENELCYIYSSSWKNNLILNLTLGYDALIWKYIKYLRKSEYCLNNKKRIGYIFYERKKNKIGRYLGFSIPPNTFGKGLKIYHQGSIVVNPKVRVGEFCKIHGDVCIGNNGKNDVCPRIGNNVDIGMKACIIGDIIINDNTIIGANALVNKSFSEKNITIVGIPAIKIK